MEAALEKKPAFSCPMFRGSLPVSFHHHLSYVPSPFLSISFPYKKSRGEGGGKAHRQRESLPAQTSPSSRVNFCFGETLQEWLQVAKFQVV